MRRFVPPVIACMLIGLSAAPAARAQDPPPAAAAAAQAYTFATGAGILFFYVRPDRTTDFEAVVARLSESLDGAQDAVRRQQAASWRMFRSAEAVKESAIYVFSFDPAVPGADYDPVKLLAEAVPAEAQALYEKLKAAIVRVERMGLARLR
ncbi:MAG TPA: hypothetical protein VFO31_24265 [Vicinamibacterales bacterium]|nr:hypothetical protein [Vicinamibacterales bacterium]